MFRNGEPTTKTGSPFARLGGSGDQPKREAEAGTFQPLRPSDGLPIATSGTDFFGRTPVAPPQPEPPQQDAEKKRKKRYLLLLLLLFIAFATIFLATGGFGSFGDAEDQLTAGSLTSTPIEGSASVTNETGRTSEAAHKEVPEVATTVTSEDAKLAVVPAAKPGVTETESEELEPIKPTAIPDRIADVMLPSTQYDISYPVAIEPPARAVKSKTNFVAFEVSAKLQEDPETRVFSMVPTEGFGGTGTLLWSTITGSVVFRTKNLAANRVGSNYVLYYIDEQNKAQRMMSFTVASGAELMLIPSRIPSRTVKRVVLTLESSVKTKEGNITRRDEVLYSDYKDKVAVMKPLK